MAYAFERMTTDADMCGKGYVHWKSWQEAYPGLVSEEYLRARTQEKCVEMARKWPQNTIVAKDNGRVVGFVCWLECGDEEDCGEIGALYILREYYGTGLGRRLMDCALRELDGFGRVALWVLAENKRAVRFYEKCGFAPDGTEREANMGRPVKVIRMVMRR